MANVGDIVYYHDGEAVWPAIVVAKRGDTHDLTVFNQGPCFTRSGEEGDQVGSFNTSADGFAVPVDGTDKAQAAQEARNQPESPSPAPAEGAVGPATNTGTDSDVQVADEQSAVDRASAEDQARTEAAAAHSDANADDRNADGSERDPEPDEVGHDAAVEAREANPVTVEDRVAALEAEEDRERREGTV